MIVWQSDALTRVLRSVLVIPRTTNGRPTWSALTRSPCWHRGVSAAPEGPPQESVALAFQLRAIPKSALVERIRPLMPGELAEVELTTDEALGRVEPE